MVKSINIGGTLFSLDRCAVMSIINITDDSFFSASRAVAERDIAKAIEKAIEDGADIIDFGAYSSRPGASDIRVEQEIERLLSAVAALRSIAGYFPFSIDSFRSEVVRAIYDSFGSFIVNDITSGDADREMITLVGELSLPYVAMHMRGTPQTMSSLTEYDDIVGDLFQYFTPKIKELKEAGVKDIIIDPGFGFAKGVDQNMELMRRMDELKVLGCPILAGVSRKSMIYKSLETTPEDALIGTALMNWEALGKGASILRVHDSYECWQTITLFERYHGRSIKL